MSSSPNTSLEFVIVVVVVDVVSVNGVCMSNTAVEFEQLAKHIDGVQ